jgi:hypothetical protein
VDAGLPHRDALLQALGAADSNRQLEVLWLDPRRDGVLQVTSALAARHGLDAVHVVSHGADGSIELGNAPLGSHNVLAQAASIAGWRHALSEAGDLLFYGCDVAAGANGRNLLHALAALTGAEVAASSDRTGQPRLGGDWILEYRTGRIEADPVIPATLQDAWTGLLPVTTLNVVRDTYIKGSLADNSLNFGASTTLMVDRETIDLQRILLSFELSSIPAGSTISSAFLRMQATAVAANMNISAFELLESWSEGAGTGTAGVANWLDRAAGTAWTTPGSSYNPAALWNISVNAPGQHSWNVTPLVQAWIAGTSTNNGLMVGSPDGGGNRTVTYISREGGTPPFLEITYTPPSGAISGTVFEDVSYGGGAGRSRATALANGGSARSAARVELFNASSGAFIAAVLTNSPNGDYAFTALAAGSYAVRVVSSSVTSSRIGYAPGLLPVLTFRTDAPSGTAAGATNDVGGHDPATPDAGNAAAGWILNATTGVFTGSGSGKAHAFAPVTVGGATVSGVDFGFNFNAIVNGNNAGQGSLRQFITNANALGGDAGLAQSGRPAGIENGLFMISNGTAAAGLRATNDYFSGGVATISLTSGLPVVSTPMAIDAQAQPGWSSPPIIALNGAGAGASQPGLHITSGSCIVRGLVVDRFSSDGITLASAGAIDNVIAENVITANGSAGVRVTSGTSNAIARNSIFGNRGLGIDLGNAGVTPNDGAQTGGQPNLAMDAPVFSSATLQAGTLTVVGYVGVAPGQALFAGSRVEIFESDNDASGYGEGPTYLGFLTADANGQFSGSLAAAGLVIGERISGTATDVASNTSEFGPQCVATGVPVMTMTNVSAVLSDPANGAADPKRIPGAVVEYGITLTNTGDGSPDAGSTVVVDPIDAAALALHVTTGVTFADGTTGSGVSLGTVAYSATPAPGPYVYNYTPVPDVDGYDGNVTSLKVTTNGAFAFGGAPPPSFTLRFRVRVK